MTGDRAPDNKHRIAFDEVGSDGTDLRHVFVDGVEVAARIYFALRTHQWSTVPFDMVRRHATPTDGGFMITVELRSADPAFPVDATVRFVAEGSTLTTSTHAVAHASFLYNRLGLCFLHPLHNHIGRDVAITRGSRVEQAQFGVGIVPQLIVDGIPAPMFGTDFDKLKIDLEDGRLDILFSGDTFEMEDQRNWSDASFKSYSTPLRSGTRLALAGQTFEQAIALSFTGASVPRTPVTFGAVGAVMGALPRVSLWSGPPSGSLYRPDNGFPALNRQPPTAADLRGAGAVSFGINGAVHAADDASILETAAVHGVMIRQARSMTRGAPVHVGPLDFDSVPGEWRNEAGFVPAPPSRSTDPRRVSSFGAAWVVASLASAAGSGAATLSYYDRSVENSPAGDLIAELAGHVQEPVRPVSTPPGVAAVAIGPTVYEADLTVPYAVRKRPV